MKHSKQSTVVDKKTIHSQVVQWAQALTQLYACIAPRFARREPRRGVLAYLQGILSAAERKNSWQCFFNGNSRDLPV